jgi:hypothetical protein
MALQDSFAYVSTGNTVHKEALRTPLVVNSSKKWVVTLYVPVEALNEQDVLCSLYSQQACKISAEKDLIRIASSGVVTGAKATTTYVCANNVLRRSQAHPRQYLRVCFALCRPNSWSTFGKKARTQKVFKLVLRRAGTASSAFCLLSFESYKRKVPSKRAPRECGMRRTNTAVSYTALFSRANAKTCPREWYSQIARVVTLPSQMWAQEILRISHDLEEQARCQELPHSDNIWQLFQQICPMRPRKIPWMLCLDRMCDSPRILVSGRTSQGNAHMYRILRRELRYVLNLYQVGVDVFETTMLSVVSTN